MAKVYIIMLCYDYGVLSVWDSKEGARRELKRIRARDRSQLLAAGVEASTVKEHLAQFYISEQEVRRHAD